MNSGIYIPINNQRLVDIKIYLLVQFKINYFLGIHKNSGVFVFKEAYLLSTKK